MRGRDETRGIFPVLANTSACWSRPASEFCWHITSTSPLHLREIQDAELNWMDKTSKLIRKVCRSSCNQLHKIYPIGETPSLRQINDIGCMMIGAAQWFEI